MLLKVRVPEKHFLLFTLLLAMICFPGCSKESSNTVNVEYQLEASINTADHFYVTYLSEHGDTIVEHQHGGWKYSFSATKPFKAYLEAQVYPIDNYVFTIKILRDGNIVQRDSASTASGARKAIRLAYTAN
ncbi:MAG: hypothetical protein JWQ40_2127 [Segetibacter sp.]|nr:hypothetical protein [Segetibacter sp.]